MTTLDSAALAAHTEIRDVAIRLNRYALEGDGAAIAALYAPGGALEVTDGESIQRFDSPDQIAVSAVGAAGLIHVTTDALVDVGGDDATHSCRFLLFSSSPDGSHNNFLATGTYSDELVRTSQGWRMKFRRAQMDTRFAALMPSGT